MSGVHTSGPWTMSALAKPTPDAPMGGDIAILDGAGNIIAECFVWVNEAQTVDAAAHARWIIAAQEMLAALQADADAMRAEEDHGELINCAHAEGWAYELTGGSRLMSAAMRAQSLRECADVLKATAIAKALGGVDHV